MKIIIAGGSGFIGRYLSKYLEDSCHKVIVLSRNPSRAQDILPYTIQCLQWKDFDASDWQDELETSEVVINLIGENISQWPWTDSYKKRIVDSRVNAGKTITQAIKQAHNKPRILIQASASGYYGNQAINEVTEQAPAGDGFLAEACRQWEESSAKVQTFGVKRIIIRTGLMLGKDGGLLKKMILPFKFFMGGPIGSGKQILPWIHIHDEAGAIRFLIENEPSEEIYNLNAPQPVNMNNFAKSIGKIMRRPAFFSVPESIIKVIFGTMGRETILASQNVVPQALIQSGYQFKYPKLMDALANLMN